MGGVMFCVTKTEAEAVQLFTKLVTMMEYEPGAFTVGMRVFCPLTMLPPAVAVQKKLYPGPLDEPVPSSVTVGLLQVICWLTTITAAGSVKSRSTKTVAEPVQPFWVLVTMSV